MSSTAESWHPSQEATFPQPSDWLLDCAFAEENAAGFALGALNPDETARIALHLSWCSGCARLVHEERRTVGYLLFLSPQAAAPASAKRALFDRIHADQQVKAALAPTLALSTTPAAGFDLFDGPLGHTIASDIAPSKQAPGKRRFTWEFAAAPLAAVPLVVALALVGGWAMRTQSRLDRQTAQATVLQSQNAQLAAQITLLSSGQSRKFALDSGDDQIGGRATGNLTAISGQTFAFLSVSNMPQNPSGYEVLVETQNGQMVPAGEFLVNADGTGSLQLQIPSPVMDYQAVHVQRVTTPKTAKMTASTDGRDVLWMDLDSNLGGQSGTDADAKAH